MDECRTDYLFGNNSFIIGAGSVLNLFGNYFDYKEFHTCNEADATALANDWGVIGQDIADIILNEQK